MTILRPSGRFRGAEVIDAEREHLEPEELRRFFDVLKTPERSFWNAYFRLQYYFGCRISEPAVVFKEDVSLATKQIILRRLKKRQFGTKLVEGDAGGKAKRVKDESNKVSDGFAEKVYSLPPALVKLLSAHMKATEADKRTKNNPWLFPSRRKPRAATNRLSLMRRVDQHTAVSRHTAEGAFVEVATLAGLPEGLRHSHVLRHTRATLMLAEGAREEDVKELLGHSSIATTRRYIGIAQALRLRLATTAQLGTGEDW